MSTANELQISSDFERLPEFRLLVNTLKGVCRPVAESKITEAAAVFLWMRLYVELAFLARSTNRPGVLTPTGKTLFEATLEPLFGEGCDPTQLLVEAQVLEKRDGEWFCSRFAHLNSHFAGNYVKKEVRGQAASALERSRHRLAQDAAAQAMLLPPEIYKKRDGSPMNDTEINRSMVLIKTVDNCLKIPGRTKRQYTEGLIADACAVIEQFEQESLREIYIWIANHRDHPALPKTTEQILRDFETIARLTKS